MSVGSSAFSGSSPRGLFQSINFMQLYMLLILLRVHLPKKIIDFILLNDIFNFNIKIPGLRSLPLIKSLLFIFKIEHSDEALHNLSVDSVSTFYNLFDHLVIFLATVGIHLIFWLMKSICPKRKSENCIVRLTYWIANKAWSLFTFTIYIRTIMQVSQFWMISAVSELYEANFSSDATSFSFAVAVSAVCGVIIFAVVNGILCLWYPNSLIDYFKEYFSGMKNTKIAKMYNVVLMTRRIALVSLMACLRHLDKVYLVLIAVCYQIAHTVLIVLIRPYASVKDNINEIMIDVVFSVLLITLMYFNTEDTWNGVVASAYFYLLSFP